MAYASFEVDLVKQDLVIIWGKERKMFIPFFFTGVGGDAFLVNNAGSFSMKRCSKLG